MVLGHKAGAGKWLVRWSGLSWILAGLAYAGFGPRIFGKRSNGEMQFANVILMLPYLVYTHLVWRGQVFFYQEPSCNEIMPGLWLGRRCSLKELPPGVSVIVDLTAEFQESKEVRAGRTYLCMPILDASAPSMTQFQELVQTVAAASEPVYIHCALGHGRSAMAVVAVLLARGGAGTLDEAEQRVRLGRPKIKMNTVQRHLLQQWAAQA